MDSFSNFTAVTGWRTYYVEKGELYWSPILGVLTDKRGELRFVEPDSRGIIDYSDDIENLAFITHESLAEAAVAQWRTEEHRTEERG